MESFFLNDAKRVFTIRTAADVASGSHNASEDSNRPNLAQKSSMFATDDAFYKSAYEDSNYGSNKLQEILVNNFGTNTLANLKTPIVIPAYEEDMSRYVVFSNFNDPAYFIGNTETIVNVCRASSAAPVYLPAHDFNGHFYSDGGQYANDLANRTTNLTNQAIIDLYYYKFQPKFPEDFPNELDNSTPAWFSQLANLIDTHYSDESDEISSIINRLGA